MENGKPQARVSAPESYFILAPIAVRPLKSGFQMYEDY
jgi:hypothetical protein